MLPDVELALTTWARGMTDATVCTELPADLAGALPLVQIERIGGVGDRFSADARVDVDVYAPTYEAAVDLAASVHDALVYLHGVVGAIVVRDVRVDSLPSRRPYGNPAAHRVGASYTVSARPNVYA